MFITSFDIKLFFENNYFKKILSVICRFENNLSHELWRDCPRPGVHCTGGAWSHGHKCGPALVPPPEPELRDRAVIS